MYFTLMGSELAINGMERGILWEKIGMYLAFKKQTTMYA